jgi:hypothetical protein
MKYLLGVILIVMLPRRASSFSPIEAVDSVSVPRLSRLLDRLHPFFEILMPMILRRPCPLWTHSRLYSYLHPTLLYSDEASLQSRPLVSVQAQYWPLKMPLTSLVMHVTSARLGIGPPAGCLRSGEEHIG